MQSSLEFTGEFILIVETDGGIYNESVTEAANDLKTFTSLQSDTIDNVCILRYRNLVI